MDLNELFQYRQLKELSKMLKLSKNN